ncbi:hypothetical protein BH09PAT3_BH09PAT3_0530 [soil metagenome]
MASSDYHMSAYDLLLHDYAEPSDTGFIDALVSSGDCFVTLATELDGLTHESRSDVEVQQATIERTIQTLLYLQRHYKIVKSAPNYRQ